MDTREAQLWHTVKPLLRQGRAWDLVHIKTCIKHAEHVLAAGDIPEELRDCYLPAVMLHDIGWAFMPHEAKAIGAYSQPASREAHMRIGAEKAAQLLKTAGYDEQAIATICTMIGEHDNPYLGKPFRSHYTKYLREIDLLWRVTEENFWKVVKLKQIEPEKLLAKRLQSFTDAIVTPTGQLIFEELERQLEARIMRRERCIKEVV